MLCKKKRKEKKRQFFLLCSKWIELLAHFSITGQSCRCTVGNSRTVTLAQHHVYEILTLWSGCHSKLGAYTCADVIRPIELRGGVGGGVGSRNEPQIFQHRFMVFVLTLPIKASHLLAPLTGARHHVLEGAEPLAREERSSKRTPRWRREEGERARGGREEGGGRGGGEGGGGTTWRP